MFWREADGFFDLKLPQLHPLTWSRDLLDGNFMSKDKAAIAISVMWAIWSSRNKYTHEEIKFHPSRSMDLIQELIQALHVPGMPSSGVTLCKAKWHPPAAGTIKINTDGCK